MVLDNDKNLVKESKFQVNNKTQEGRSILSSVHMPGDTHHFMAFFTKLCIKNNHKWINDLFILLKETYSAKQYRSSETNNGNKVNLQVSPPVGCPQIETGWEGEIQAACYEYR